MDFTNASAPLPRVEEETQLPLTLVATTVKVEVTDGGMNENSVNGGGVRSGEGSVAVEEGGGESGDVDSTVRRKRGRPRKYPVESRECLPSLQNLVPKRGRGRPPGTKKLQLATMGRVSVDTAGGNFTPHVLNILGGEDIFGRILSVVVQVSPRSVCILSAVGAVAIVDICPAGCFGSDVLRYEGHFPIAILSGTFTLTEAGRRKGRLTVGLADADASVFGGLVVGSIIAAEPTQIVLGSFKESKKTLLKTESAESSTAADGLGRFRVPPTTVQLPEEIEEKFIATPLSPHPKPPNGNANQDVDRASLQNSDQNASEPSDHASDSTTPDN
ncbi:AT-hook motif nuclear-localized protein 10-like isoform X1 [Rhododendron vialii]|uniref:AT-hook motif nuclear-localized protein 10-like isoform X1 n=1 Tax=Rhododendron vialii TaxID=182163 RepID=UPI00265EB5DA|nr:AT-hook motif nuclear-localized protein 10-like isoform X1 [Rhododendron vialii]XP_058198165.1 AT-hook motif nuclear-localized protein 10-like isoform X1 [Rhododendron vialii]XP_058198166.1 AT-hook motif nuclear-localized protein 10-like isoform X1 [Rhododendron vialii]XP_058198167.1 AT-hook motif nuclear-localized protein 10-like isoform X1 [Rhododendron vialii]